MDPALRLRYLEAMGIPQLVARVPMPGAKPSQRIELVAVPAAAETEQISAPPEPVATRASLADALTAPATTARTVSDQRTPPTTAVTPNTASPSHATTTPFTCQCAIWRIGQWLVLTDTSQFDSTANALLNNILFALGEDASKLGVSADFHWPMARVADTSQHAAIDYLQGYLEGGALSQDTVQQILVLGHVTASLLPETGPGRYGNWPLTILPDLHSMLTSPTNKAIAWRALSHTAISR